MGIIFLIIILSLVSGRHRYRPFYYRTTYNYPRRHFGIHYGPVMRGPGHHHHHHHHGPAGMGRRF